MISAQDIALWSIEHPWQSGNQVEQDLLLSQAICKIANDPLLRNELILRGGTAYHKLFLPEPLRYSEDLDYVRTTTGGIGPVMRRLSDLGTELGYSVRTKMGLYPKVVWRFTFASGIPGKVKIEINTFERSPVMDLCSKPLCVDCRYCEEEALVPTFQAEELVATKLRALYQRSKGRDLFDLWLALTELELDPEIIVGAFPTYRPEGITAQLMTENLSKKLEDSLFLHDMDNLIRPRSISYDPAEAAAAVTDQLIVLLD